MMTPPVGLPQLSSAQPSSLIALNGLSEITVIPAGSLDVPGGGGGGMASTVTAAPALTPSLVAVICAVPVASANTSPVGDTVTTVLLLELQAIARPLSTLLLASVRTAVAWVV